MCSVFESLGDQSTNQISCIVHSSPITCTCTLFFACTFTCNVIVKFRTRDKEANIYTIQSIVIVLIMNSSNYKYMTCIIYMYFENINDNHVSNDHNKTYLDLENLST